MSSFGLRLNGFRSGCVLDNPRGYTYSEALTPLVSESNSIKGPMAIRGAGMGTRCGVQSAARPEPPLPLTVALVSAAVPTVSLSRLVTADKCDPERWDDFSKPFLFLA
jgi:hypothetical protein